MPYVRHTLFALALSAGCACTMAAEISQDSLSKVKESVQKGRAVLVDVRAKREWDDGHIEGAIFLPVTDVQDGLSEEELKKLPKDKILYVHCVVGKRALTAANVFEKHGYSVRPIKPGFKELIAAGFAKAK